MVRSLDEIKQSALGLHQAGKLAEAEAAYREALAMAPGDTDCLHMLGVACYQGGRFDEALQLIDRARAPRPANVDAIEFNRAMVVSGILGRCAQSGDLPSTLGVSRPRCTRVECGLPLDGGDKLVFTGERFVPELGGAIWAEHWHRYCAIRPLAAGRSVIDAACGEGYGSGFLADVARSVIGIDVSPETARHAADRYRHPNLRFAAASVTALPIASGSIDLVVSFETIEHLAQQAEMLAEFRRVLAEDGILVLSSPNKPVYSANGTFANPHHVKELTREELASMLQPAFPQQQWYRQRNFVRSTLWKDADGASSFIDTPAMYFVVVCASRDAHLPSLSDCSVLVRGQSRTLLLEADTA